MDQKKGYIALLDVEKFSYNLTMDAHTDNYWYSGPEHVNLII